MILRALILLGWKKVDSGPNSAINLYTGGDGVELEAAHAKALETGEYIAFRKLINPSGVPMPVTIDPKPKPPVFPKVEAQKQPEKSKAVQEMEKFEADQAVKIKAENDRRAAVAKAQAEQQAIVDTAEKAAKLFATLSLKSKSDLLAEVEDMNETLAEKITLPPDPKKTDIITAILTAKKLTAPK